MRRGLTPVLTTLVLVACLLGLRERAPDLLYALQGDARDLGARPAASELRDGGHVHLAARVRLATAAEYEGEKRDLALIEGAPVAVLLRAGAAASAGGEVRATGRLYRADRLGNLYTGNPWVRVAQLQGVPVDGLFVLVDGVQPGVPWGALAFSALFLVMLLFSAWRLVRALRPRLPDRPS